MISAIRVEQKTLPMPQNVMRVLIVRDRAASGGGIYNYYQAVTGHLGVRHRFVDIGRPHRFYNGSRGLLIRITIVRLLAEWMNLCRVVLLFRPDIVHVNPSIDPECNCRGMKRDAISVAIARIFRKRVVVFWRGWNNECCGSPEMPCGNRGWMRRVYGSANAHIVLASDFRDDLRRWGFKGPIYLETTVVADSVIEGFTEPSSIRDSTVFRLLFLSRVEVAKGVLELLDALALLNQRRSGYFHLKIAGDGPDLELLKQRASDLELSNIEFAGFVEGMDRALCYAEADAFCFLSYTEGMPNAVLEAMAMGLPLVSSDAGGLKDILEDGVTGYIVAQDRSQRNGERFSPEDVAGRIERLAASEEVCRTIGEHNREYARERFVAAKVASRLEAIYREVFGLDVIGVVGRGADEGNKPGTIQGDGVS